MATHGRTAPRSDSRIGQTVRARALAGSVPLSVALAVVVSLVVAGLCLTYVWQAATVRELTAQRESMSETLTDTRELNRLLQAKLEQAFSPQRVAFIARSELGMHLAPSETMYIHLDADSSR